MDLMPKMYVEKKTKQLPELEKGKAKALDFTSQKDERRKT